MCFFFSKLYELLSSEKPRFSLETRLSAKPPMGCPNLFLPPSASALELGPARSLAPLGYLRGRAWIWTSIWLQGLPAIRQGFSKCGRGTGCFTTWDCVRPLNQSLCAPGAPAGPFNKLSRRFWYKLESDNHCHKVYWNLWSGRQTTFHANLHGSSVMSPSVVISPGVTAGT